MSGERSVQRVLPCRLSSVTVGRHLVRDTLLAWNLPELIEDAELGVSELLANAVRHAGTPPTLTVACGERVVLTVADGDAALRRPIPRSEADMLAEAGRGLQIVAAIAADWGVQALPAGKAIWFALPMPASGAPDADVVAFADHRHPVRTAAPEASSVQALAGAAV